MPHDSTTVVCGETTYRAFLQPAAPRQQRSATHRHRTSNLSSAFDLGQEHLAQSNGVGRDLYQFIVFDIFECCFE